MSIRFFTCFLSLSIIAGCSITRKQHNNSPSPTDLLDAKMEPYEQFLFQRSFPDRTIEWQRFQKAMDNVRTHDVAMRNNNPCTGNRSNWTIQGPYNVAGRANTLVAKPGNEDVLLAGFTAGGIFKSTDGGVTWKAVFDDHPVLAIGDLTFDPSNSNVVYASTGDPNMPSIVFNGQGIYKSTDEGETWTYLGLEEVGIISKVEVHPTNPNILLAAAMGNPFKRDANRGVYKSTDGGQHWTKVLFVSEQAGASDLIIDKQNPQVVYASFWDRIRNNQESIIDGPNAKIFKSVDGGNNWTMLGGGLPTGRNGRTGLALSATNSQKIYAVFVDSLAKAPLIYKSTNAGSTWTALNTIGLHTAYGGFGWYFGKIRLNPINDEELYCLAVSIWKKASNSTQFSIFGGMHADVHELIFMPSGRKYTATDGGIYRNNPNQGPWTKCLNLPTTQFYHTNVSPHEPQLYYAGAQDNGINKGNVLALNAWQSVFPADGFRTQFHPTDSGTIYAETQNGEINRSLDAGVTWENAQVCLNGTDRCNWDMPFFASTHVNPNFLLYAGTFKVYSANGAGPVSWAPISGDLTDGVIYGARFHNISCLNESPVVQGKLLAGTSDGNVWRKEPSGSWVNITAGLPNRYVTSVHYSQTAENRIFVTHSGWRDNEKTPHIHRSNNNGSSWSDISGDLPDVPVNDLLVLPGYADSILIAATDAGVYYTRNGGVAWDRLGGNMPFIPVFDLERNAARKEIAAATHARGLWTFSIDSILVQNVASAAPVMGLVKSETGAGVGNVSVAPANTDTTGTYKLVAPYVCQSITLRPYRNDAQLNGVSTFDLLLISKHILGIQPISSPYTLMAADANRSSSVTSFDMVVLRKLLLGIDTVLANNTSWRFVPAQYVFPTPDNPFAAPVPDSIAYTPQITGAQNLNFVGFKVGDINGNANPSLAAEADDRSDRALPVYFENKQFTADDIFETTFRADEKQYSALQFTLNFDPNILEILSIECLAEGMSEANFGKNRLEKGILTFSFDRINDSGSSALFKIICRAKKAGQMMREIALSSKVTKSAGFDFDGNILTPILITDNPLEVAAVFAPTLVGNHGTTCKFSLSADGPMRIVVFDNLGKLVFRSEKTYPSGQHQLEIESDVFPESGTYFYQIQVNGKVDSGKLIVQKS